MKIDVRRVDDASEKRRGARPVPLVETDDAPLPQLQRGGRRGDAWARRARRGRDDGGHPIGGGRRRNQRLFGRRGDLRGGLLRRGRDGGRRGRRSGARHRAVLRGNGGRVPSSGDALERPRSRSAEHEKHHRAEDRGTSRPKGPRPCQAPFSKHRASRVARRLLLPHASTCLEDRQHAGALAAVVRVREERRIALAERIEAGHAAHGVSPSDATDAAEVENSGSRRKRS